MDRIEVDDSWLALMHLGRGRVWSRCPMKTPMTSTHASSRPVDQPCDPASAAADCLLVMTDGAATLLNEHDLRRRAAIPCLIARENAWTSGQWMTERSGGSDVGVPRPGRCPR